MDFEAVYREMALNIDEERLRPDCPMKEYTSFRAGGNAALLVEPGSMAELFSAVEVCGRTGAPYMVMGNGSNLLFRDGGYEGVVIRIGPGIDRIRVEGNVIFAEAGMLLSAVAKAAMEHSLTGLEFASGIPGSLGGAVFMNAGAYGGEMKNVVLSTMALRPDGMIKDRKTEDMGFGYRHSVFQETGEIIVGVKLLLKPGDQDEIRETMRDLTARRNEKQPVNLPSAGSFFKRPEGYFAGGLIEECGLKGLSLGGARVSPLHAGFIVNEGGATAGDILDLMRVVQETVYDKKGVRLEPEVRIIG